MQGLAKIHTVDLDTFVSCLVSQSIIQRKMHSHKFNVFSPMYFRYLSVIRYQTGEWLWWNTVCVMCVLTDYLSFQNASMKLLLEKLRIFFLSLKIAYVPIVFLNTRDSQGKLKI